MANELELTVLPNITRQSIFALCGCLSGEQDSDKDSIHSFVEEEQWLALIALANAHWLLGALAHQLQISRVWDKLSDELRDYLQTFEQSYLQRSEAIMRETLLVSDLLNKAGIELVLLKGAASLFNGVASPISSRFMCDIDLLVPETQQNLAQEVLMAAGFKPQQEEFAIQEAGHHHETPLIRDGGICFVELHRWPVKHSTSVVLKAAEVWQQAQSLMLTEELTVKQASPTQQIILAIAHSEISDRAYAEKQLDLRFLTNLYVTARHFHQQINWQEVSQHFHRAQLTQPLSATLYALYTLFGLLTPITDPKDPLAKVHFEQCLTLYLNSFATESTTNKLANILKGYRQATIIDLYGQQGSHPVLVGRIKHLVRHVKIIISKILRA